MSVVNFIKDLMIGYDNNHGYGKKQDKRRGKLCGTCSLQVSKKEPLTNAANHQENYIHICERECAIRLLWADSSEDLPDSPT